MYIANRFFVVAVVGGSVFCLEIRHFGRLQLKLQFVSDQGDKLRVRGFSLGITDRIPEEPLQSVQIPSVPGNLDGVADCSFHPAGCGLEGLRHLRVQNLGDGVSLACGQQEGRLTAQRKDAKCK